MAERPSHPEEPGYCSKPLSDAQWMCLLEQTWHK